MIHCYAKRLFTSPEYNKQQFTNVLRLARLSGYSSENIDKSSNIGLMEF